MNQDEWDELMRSIDEEIQDVNRKGRVRNILIVLILLVLSVGLAVSLTLHMI